jgi:hypothetical protein
MEHFMIVMNLYEDLQTKFESAKTPEDHQEVIKASTHFLLVWKKMERAIIENCLKMSTSSYASV